MAGTLSADHAPQQRPAQATELPGDATPILTKVSIVGGVSLQAPPEIEIRVGGFRLFGGVRIEPGRHRFGHSAQGARIQPRRWGTCD
jgi:hypothetical protein